MEHLSKHKQRNMQLHDPKYRKNKLEIYVNVTSCNLQPLEMLEDDMFIWFQ